MHQATNPAFERIVRGFAEWRAVPEDERSPAPPWWWGPAFEARDLQQPMPVAWCSSLELPDGSTFAAGANMLLASLAGQTSLPWAGDFPRKPKSANPA
ncbi:MAG TPA: hypothetical protein VGM09_13055 [Bradyrhizobium sp.]